MTRINRRKGVPKGDRPLKENDEIDARDPVKLPVQPRDELRQAEARFGLV